MTTRQGLSPHGRQPLPDMEREMRHASEENINRMICDIAGFNDTPGEGITRVALTDADLAARDYLKSEMKNLGMDVRQDAAGNIYGRLQGSDPSLAPVWTGSHVDSVLNGGAFDGVAGIVCGLEAASMIRDSGETFRRSIEVVVFTSEEPTRFGLGCIGSRIMAGKLSWKEACEILDKDGRSLAEILGCSKEEFENVKKNDDDVAFHVELHIEQGEQLEQKKLPVGVVTTISAPTEIQVRICGKQRHAGATPMAIRVDPVAAMAELSVCLESLAREAADPSTVFTIGEISVDPNTSNVIPREVSFSIDLRSAVPAEKETIMNALIAKCEELEQERGVQILMNVLCDDQPVQADRQIISLIEAGCDHAGLPFMDMASGAYHDSLFVADFAPFGMIFVPSRDGISHDREEFTSKEELAAGTDVLAETLLALASC